MSDAGHGGYVLPILGIIAAALIPKSCTYDGNWLNLDIPKKGPIQEALNKGVTKQQLQDAFLEIVQKAAPEVANGEVKRLEALCKNNGALLASHDIDWNKVCRNFKPQGPS